MSRTKRSATLDSRSARISVKLAAGVRHQTPLVEGLYLAYRKPKSGQAGTWMARLWDKDAKAEKQVKLGVADDILDADGIKILTYRQAQDAAEAWFKEAVRQAEQVRTGGVIHAGPCTVAVAWSDYLDAARTRGVKGISRMQSVANVHILPGLGGIEVSQLTRGRITQWHYGLANIPRQRPRTQEGDANFLAPAVTEDAKRARRDTANRILTNLKAALTYALDSGRISNQSAPWRKVKPFPDTTKARIRFMNAEEQQKLIAACDPDFRVLVTAGLMTGARFGELAKALVCDFDPKASTLFINQAKGVGSKSRHIYLTAEAVEWFSGLVKGRPSDDLMFRRSGVTRTTREDLKDWAGWAESDQQHPMTQAVAKAGIAKVTFHELRHTYASSLLNQGVPLIYVTAQLGHANSKMTEKHYGHLAKDDMLTTIRRMTPTLNLPLEVRQADPPAPLGSCTAGSSRASS